MRGVMKRETDTLIALQFLAVVLPIAVVLLSQMVVDARRAAALEHSRPLRILAEEARANYKTFTNGAADAVDTGTLGGLSVTALHVSAQLLRQLESRGESTTVRNAATLVQELAQSLPKGVTLDALLPLRERIIQGDALTDSINQEFQRRDEFVVKDAITSAALQKRAVAVALIFTAVLTVIFVLTTRRRLKERLEADIAKERRRRAELETLSVRFGVATSAARAGVYEVNNEGADVWWSDTMYELYAQAPGEFQPTLASWMARIHPEDQEATQSAITAAMQERKPLRSQYRAVRPDGSVCHIASLAAVVEDAVHRNPRLVGIDLDISDRVESELRERKLQQQLRDTSRQAGMAEIATNVLHNVGNVLNSVNVSASMVTDNIKKSRVGGLGKVVALLEEHQSDLGGFIANDDRGRHLPHYLMQLADHLNKSQSATLVELDMLSKNIEHIKEIVAMQQGYAKLVGVPERVAVATLVEDALRMNAGAFSRHGVTLQRQFDESHSIVVDKHKVLQILVNLLRNAKYACEEAGTAVKQVIVRISTRPGGVRIAVVDNGIGIRREHMAKMFTHGFTTKNDGHGFGLHSGSLSARELGGSLQVDSAGPGHGATFTLDLPDSPLENNHE